MGKLAEKKRRNEKAILGTAFKLFAEQGFESTTISDIVKGSGLARGTFYNYYQSKEEIWEKLVNEFVSEVNSRLRDERQKATTIWEFTYNAFTGYARVLQEKGYIHMLIKNQPIFRKTIFDHGFLNSLYQDLEDDLTHSTFYQGMDRAQIRMTTYAMVGSAIELIFQSHSGLKETSVEELGRYFADLFIGGYTRMLSN